MFGRKKENQTKVKEPSPREIFVQRLVGEIESLAPGQVLTYQLPEFYWTGFAAFLIVEPNPTYPEKGKKYLMCTDKIADGKPAGRKIVTCGTDKAKDAAQWIADRDGQWGSVTRFEQMGTA